MAKAGWKSASSLSRSLNRIASCRSTSHSRRHQFRLCAGLVAADGQTGMATTPRRRRRRGSGVVGGSVHRTRRREANTLPAGSGPQPGGDRSLFNGRNVMTFSSLRRLEVKGHGSAAPTGRVARSRRWRSSRPNASATATAASGPTGSRAGGTSPRTAHWARTSSRRCARVTRCWSSVTAGSSRPSGTGRCTRTSASWPMRYARP